MRRVAIGCLLPIVIVAVAAAGFVWLKHSKAEKPEIVASEKAWRVKTMPAQFSSITPQLSIYGRVETPRYANVTSALTADVISVAVLEGDRVAADAVLVQLDPRDTGLLMQQRTAELAEVDAKISAEHKRYRRDKAMLVTEKELAAYTQAAVVRARKLAESRLTTQVNLDEALAAQARQQIALQRLQYDVADHPSRVAQLKAQRSRATTLLAKASLDNTRSEIKAPFAGRVAQLDVAVGDRVRVGMPLLSLYAVDKLEVRAQIPQQYVATVRTALAQGKSLMATATITGQEYQFKLMRLAAAIQAGTGGLDALFRVQHESNALTLGDFVDLQLSLPAVDNVLAIPAPALYGLAQVFRVVDDRLQTVDVQRVGTVDSNVLVRSTQLQANDEIVITQLPNAMTGLLVERVIPAKSETIE